MITPSYRTIPIAVLDVSRAELVDAATELQSRLDALDPESPEAADTQSRLDGLDHVLRKIGNELRRRRKPRVSKYRHSAG